MIILWNLKKSEEFLPKVSLKILQKQYQNENNAKAKLRLLCAIHRKQGKSLDNIVIMTQVSRTTVHDILHRFVERGIEGKDSIKQTGRPPKLTLIQQKKLINRLEQGPPHNQSGLWTTKEVKELIRKNYGIEYSSPHVWEILKMAGFSIQKPRPRHYKSASKKEVAQFKKRLLSWQKNIGKKDL